MLARLAFRAWNSTQHWAKERRFSPMSMTLTLLPSATHHSNRVIVLFSAALATCALLVLGLAVSAQVAGDRGIAPVASSSDIEVRGIKVDRRGSSGAEAREEAWRSAQREAWSRLNGPSISDSQLSGLVSAVIIEEERIGPRRYIATLGVIFDRARVAPFLGGAQRGRGSAPMLLLPVSVSGGAYTIYEVRNPWQRAWAEFQPGNSRIEYVRPSGVGGDSLLLNYGQVQRRSRAWWRAILDQFGAASVLVPVAKLEHQWPGGPIRGEFTARYGPDSEVLDSFTMVAENPQELPGMLGRAVAQFDTIFEQAFADGKLRADPTLDEGGGSMDPALARLIAIGRALEARDAAIEAGATPEPTTTIAPAQLQTHVVQFSTPDAASFDAALSGVRAVPGVRGLSVTSTAIGGQSVMSVNYAGSLNELAAALSQRGYTVQQGASAIAISR
ncbi:heavy-metal-associated domain-containing protein [Altererythrobacter sp. JGD-16]|uniref:Heavy-metal-associated domain-containing protein n=2 Tax=Altererythrobacter lutimaris TaxID=2743979 RepID=A0A850H9G2_9SPHN|nr:heavy-metal-associated domain-containing protein [Altererythrobacter lutimaris]